MRGWPVACRLVPVIMGVVAIGITQGWGAGAARSEPSALASEFTRLARSNSWQPTGEIQLPFDSFHPQGLAAMGNELVISSVEIIEATVRFPSPQDGLDRTPGKGRGHLFRLDRQGKLLAQSVIGEGDVYHPGGIDFDGRFLWVPVAEYRPDSASILYRVDPQTLAATEVLRVKDHIGGLVYDKAGGLLHGVSWGSRRFYSWAVGEDGTARTGPPEAKVTRNPSYYIDYQDCALAGPGTALCSGLIEYQPDRSKPKWALGGLDLIDLAQGRPLHQVPVLLWTRSGEAMTRNPVLIEPIPGGLRALFGPEDGRTTLYSYEVKLN